MALFQQSVITKHLASQNKILITEKWKLFTTHFHNKGIQDNIRNIREEQYQEGFLNDLFGNVLGYTLSPSPNFNLIPEQKNEKGSKKADGAILVEGKVMCVIELKGTDTTDLNKIETQAFGYKNNQKDCVYVVTSNFEKLRFYIDNAIEYIEFNLFQLTEKDFALLYLCLAYDNIASSIAKKIKEESFSQEDKITKQLYKDYSLFKNSLFHNLVLLNPTYKPLDLFKKSQKLLDRFLFLFFSEDRQLLAPNSVRRILNEWRDLQDLDEDVPLYNRFKKYFEYLNTGYKGKRYDVFAYNGGLFKPDDVLDNIKIDNELLYQHTLKLSEYDFASEVDVNILGHIFENSLNELDEMKARLEGIEIDKSATKRKKDGVFYTPKYITKYIVENTVGKLCSEKKVELQINEADYIIDKKRNIKTKKPLSDKLKVYRDWLLQLTIADPACGSGAFLNEALNFLIAEHKYVDELLAKLLGETLVLSDVEKSILENNLFGVDLNEESVEIAKLSLWLRTARPNRKLNDLNNNIKCGNSLIDDPAIAGDKAFVWQKEFPQIFEKGGFDVVIGNPPYVQSHALNASSKEFIYKNYSTAEYQINTYAIFTEKIFEIINNKSIYSIIIPNYWLSTKYDSKLRKLVFLLNDCVEVVNLFRVFEDATVDTLILTGKKGTANIFPKKTNVFSVDKTLDKIEKRLIALSNRTWSFKEKIEFADLNSDIKLSFEIKLNLKGTKVIGDFVNGYKGMQPYEEGKGIPIQTREMMNDRIYHSDIKLNETYYPLIGSSNVQSYFIKQATSFIKYGKNLASPRRFEIFSMPRILVSRIFSKKTIDATYIEDVCINNTDIFNFIPKDGNEKYLKPILSILSSNVCATFFRNSNINLNRDAFPKLNVNNILDFPLPDKFGNESLINLAQKADLMMVLNQELNDQSQKFQRSIQREFHLDELSKKLQDWYSLNFAEFLKELEKRKVKITLTQKVEWEEYFNIEATKVLRLRKRIDDTHKETEEIVYMLYELSEEEIKIIEKN